MKVGDRSSWGKDLIKDLLQRKVDTIVTDGITGRPMPDPLTALLDITNSYFRKLIRLNLVDKTANDCPKEAVDSGGWLKPNAAALKWLIDKALEGLGKPAVKSTDTCILVRIVATCKELTPLVLRLQVEYPKAFETAPLKVNEMSEVSSRLYYSMNASPPLTEMALERQELAALRRAWELGSDTVALQTVAALDGDIITRIASQYRDESFASVRQIHQEAVNLSLSTWELLAKSLGSFVDALFSRR